MDSVFIQFQDSSGWRNASILSDNVSSQRITFEMNIVQRLYPTNRIRAVDENGRLIDIL
jgi:hypothetical protein